MCHDCPHKREHEVGDSITIIKGTGNRPHGCHNTMELSCVGHQMQIHKIATNQIAIEDFTDRRVIHVGQWVTG
jgi:hypothetical protein